MRLLVIIAFTFLLISCQKKTFNGETNKSGKVAKATENVVENRQELPPPPKPTPASTPEPIPEIVPEPPPVVEPETFKKFELQFEDWTDFDFDIYFCAEGEYRLKTDELGYDRIEAAKDQTIQMVSGKLTGFGCDNKLQIKHLRNGEIIQERLVDLRTDLDIYESLTFEVLSGDLIDPVFLIGSGDLCDQDQTSGLKISMQDKERSRMYYRQVQCQAGVCKCPFFEE